ncbi:hypothetical protein LTR85_001964 [Meristemomyces frigidus]|nr:hypothetical protein LTR85_001964 [Meristemomyces frigidus]
MQTHWTFGTFGAHPTQPQPSTTLDTVLPSVEGPDRRWIILKAGREGVEPGYPIAKTIEQMMRTEQPEKEIRKAVFDLARRHGIPAPQVTLFVREVLEMSKAKREYWPQWLPPDLIACKPKGRLPQHITPRPSDPTSIGQEGSLLLKLPAELRTIIYEYVLAPPINLKLKQKNTAAGLLVPQQKTKQPGMPRTCRQLRAESPHIFYGQNTFVFYIDRLSALADAKAWVEAVGDDNIGCMQSIVLHAFELDTTPPSMDLVLRSVRYGVDLRNITAKASMGGLREARIQGKLRGMEADSIGCAVRAKEMVELLGWFGGVIADAETGKARMWGNGGI